MKVVIIIFLRGSTPPGGPRPPRCRDYDHTRTHIR